MRNEAWWLVKKGKIIKSMLPFAENILQESTKSELNGTKFSLKLHLYPLSNVVYRTIKRHWKSQVVNLSSSSYTFEIKFSFPPGKHQKKEYRRVLWKSTEAALDLSNFDSDYQQNRLEQSSEVAMQRFYLWIRNVYAESLKHCVFLQRGHIIKITCNHQSCTRIYFWLINVWYWILVYPLPTSMILKLQIKCAGLEGQWSCHIGGNLFYTCTFEYFHTAMGTSKILIALRKRHAGRNLNFSFYCSTIAFTS